MKITLREVAAGDLDEFFRFQQDADAAHMAGFAPTNPNDRSIFDHHWSELLNDEKSLVRTIDADGQPAGSIAVFRDGDVHEVMFWTDKQFWGQGITTTAMDLFLDEFTPRPLRARVVVDNVGSLKILESRGFTEVGEEQVFSNARAEVVTEKILQLN
ncbi:GNAT family N-acetyltransferase [Nesterenkonia massiliensis]|uniref:GNAT family N-acetyltransferase n=1 Tax=Nesterenkonia massiliensis TaxID=1232429 RepID=A0ABT2HMF6_9MICC|nr:GNAT family N-acetyltransferase [Nesterenkonia massiliensis]MCT1605874.1 GNAT family N-acetyltransferase [Nesterenkonia massiliensis]